MKWSQQTWDQVEPIYQQIIAMPFITELINGTLNPDAFAFYIQQDNFYLADYGKILSGIAAKLDKPGHVSAFVRFAGECILAEQDMHAFYLKNCSDQTVLADQPTPSCLLYTSYLMRQLATAPVEVAAAAVLPCFWVYKRVGDYILQNQTKSRVNPFQSWIDLYGSELYDESVKLALQVCDELAEATTPAIRSAMTQAFLMGTKMEWMFWESAYRFEKWKI